MSDLAEVFRSTLEVNLGCRAGERAVIATDTMPFLDPTERFPDRTALAECIASEGAAAGIETRAVTYEPTGGHGLEPPMEVFDAVFLDGFTEFAASSGLWHPLQEKEIDEPGLQRLRSYLEDKPRAVDAALILSNYSTSHTRFRQLLTTTGARVATMPTVEPFLFAGVMTADWPAVARRSHAAAEALNQADAAHIHSPGGRHLRLSLQGRPGFACFGDLSAPGAFGNLPGGESYVAPVEGTADGELSIGSPEQPDAWAFRFAAGSLVEIIGNPPFQSELEQLLEGLPEARQACELGIGTNEKASRPDNLLEAEKMLGTVHLALGDNAGFGGTIKVPFHCDYVVYRPTLKLVHADGLEMVAIQDGRFLLTAE